MRTFIAIEISDKRVLEKIQKFQQELQIDGKPTKINQIHFTLKFLGEINDEQCEKIKDSLREITFSQFDLLLKGVGGFPNLKNPRIVWIGTEDVGGRKLIEISNKIEARLTPLGFHNDKKFIPHLTVFRIKNKIGDASSLLKEYEAIEFGSQSITKIKLKRSILFPEGPAYSDLLVINENEK